MLNKQLAYEKWLGIKAYDQPPTLYRLLGVDAFEADPDAISYAADGRMALLRQFQISDNAKLAEQVLTELSRARVVLLNPDQKAAYDAQLREWMAERAAKLARTNSPKLPVAAPLLSQPATAPMRPEASPMSVGVDLDSITSNFRPSLHSAASARAGKRKEKSNSLVWAAVAGMALVAAGIVVAVSQFVGKDLPADDASKPVATRTETPKPAVRVVDSHSATAPLPRGNSDSRPTGVAKSVDAPATGPVQPSSAIAAPPDTSEVAGSKPIPAPPDDASPTPIADAPSPLPAETPNSPAADAGPRLPERAPLPDAKAQAAAMALIKEVYGREFAAAKTSEQKQALAEKVLRAAKENETDRASLFVLLRLSRDIATKAGDCQAACLAIEEMDKTFQIDAVEMKTDALRKCASLATAVDQQESVAEKAGELCEAAIANDNFPVAKQLNELALSEAKKAKDVPLAAQFSDRGTEIIAIANAYESVVKAAAVLRESPNDAEANFTVGKYDCFMKGNWTIGLPLLAKGNDLTLKRLAGDEIKGAASSEEQAKLGDAWWDSSETANGAEQKQMRQRANHWYYNALPGLTGLPKKRAQNRLRQLIHIAFDSPSALGNFVLMGKDRKMCSVKKGNLILSSGVGVIYKKYFQSLSSVTIRGTILAPDQHNFRIAVGRLDMILNWENDNQNIFFNGEKPTPFTRTSPPVMVANILNEIRIQNDADDTKVVVNGKQIYATKAELSGTVTVYPGNGAIAVHELVIEGIADPDRVVSGPSHNNIN